MPIPLGSHHHGVPRRGILGTCLRAITVLMLSDAVLCLPESGLQTGTPAGEKISVRFHHSYLACKMAAPICTRFATGEAF
jgi:hypothetical protein